LHPQRLVEVPARDVFDELGLANEIHHRLAAVLLRVEAEVLARGRIAPVEAIPGVEDRNPVRQRLRAAARAYDELRQLATPTQHRSPVPVQHREHFAPATYRLRRIRESALRRPVSQLAKLAPLAPEQHPERQHDESQRSGEHAHAVFALAIVAGSVRSA
jgi:hypothetical protein